MMFVAQCAGIGGSRNVLAILQSRRGGWSDFRCGSQFGKVQQSNYLRIDADRKIGRLDLDNSLLVLCRGTSQIETNVPTTLQF